MKEFVLQIPAEYRQAGIALFFLVIIVIAVFGWLDYWRKKVFFSRKW